MKLSCRCCGSNTLVYVSSIGNQHIRHGAVCAGCRKPLDALDWDLNLKNWKDEGLSPVAPPPFRDKTICND